MIKKELTVKSDIGLHARPCVKISEIARSYAGNTAITICKQASGEMADAKSVLSMLFLEVTSGQSVTLSVDGANEEKAFKEIAEIIESTTIG